MFGLCNFCKSYGFCSDPDADKAQFVLQVHPPVSLDTSRMGDEVVIIKNGSRLCGSGGCIATTSVNQDKAYFEVKIQRDGQWGIGLSLGSINVNNIPFGTDTSSWVLREDGKVYHNNEIIGQVPEIPRESDVVGVAYDHVEMSFHLNGKPLNTSVRGPKGTVFPCAFVDRDAILDFYFTNFQFVPPPGFSRIMYEQTIL
ncbi:SPRY domain-containing protein 7-like [Paramacrobiotus metropolitanus]|uniref:SPRY domain-containing protein 7-like n=1 Tax=Paramacrobiotus metropolitanus TaxID=2943436 RepID=UPI002445E6CA|nr:SPRY domain-containing protein 7-like [Paramacrobiotus metropolitanus]